MIQCLLSCFVPLGFPACFLMSLFRTACVPDPQHSDLLFSHHAAPLLSLHQEPLCPHKPIPSTLSFPCCPVMNCPPCPSGSVTSCGIHLLSRQLSERQNLVLAVIWASSPPNGKRAFAPKTSSPQSELRVEDKQSRWPSASTCFSPLSVQETSELSPASQAAKRGRMNAAFTPQQPCCLQQGSPCSPQDGHVPQAQGGITPHSQHGPCVGSSQSILLLIRRREALTKPSKLSKTNENVNFRKEICKNLL